MKKIIYLLSFVFCFNIYSYTGDLHLHLKDFKDSFSKASKNVLVNSFLESDSMKIFKSSKLYLRFKKEFLKINKGNDFFSYDNFNKLAAKNLDFYLLNTSDLDFILVMELDISQLTALVNLDLNVYEENNGEKYYKKGNLYFLIKEKNIIVSSKKANLTLYLDNSKNFITLNKANDYDNFLYLNMKKILSDYYLKTYWFNKNKDFSYINDKVEVYFSINSNNLKELSKVYLKDKLDYNKWFFKDKSSFLIKQKNLNHRLFSKDNKLFKDIEIYGASISENNINYIAKATDKEKLKKSLLKTWPNSKFSQSNGILEFKYGLLNRDSAYFKFSDNYFLISSSNKFTKVSNDNYVEYLSLDKKSFSLFSKELKSLNQRKSDYSYNQFYKNFLTMYVKNIKSFLYSSELKENYLENKVNISFK